MKTVAISGIFAALVSLTPFTAAAQTVFTDLSTFQAATTDLTVVNFDRDAAGTPFPGGTVLTNQYDAFGVQFNEFNGGDLQVGNFGPVSRPNSLNNLGGGTRGGGGFEAVFDTPATAFGLWFGGLHPATTFFPTELDLISASDELIQNYIVQTEIGNDQDGNLFFGVVSTQPIAKVQVAVGSNDFVYFDDLMFGNAVPEPSALVVALAGVGVLLTSRFSRC